MSIKQLAELQNTISGDVLTDVASLLTYSTDASIYQQIPKAVVRPKHHQDCVTLVQFATANKLSLIPRAGGTSLAGQVVGDAIVVDTSRYLTNITAIDFENKTARVEAGVIPSELNRQLRVQGLMFAPDPSTFNRATVAGLIGNNAWGVHCPQYGSTRDHVLSCNTILSNGSTVEFSALNPDQIQQKLLTESFESTLYKNILALTEQNHKTILSAYPDQVPCNTAYALHTLCRSLVPNAHNRFINLSALICGSEGTLALVSDATVKLVDIPLHKILVCCHFHSLENALHSVVLARQLNANAIELLDERIIQLTALNKNLSQYRHWLQGKPQAVLLIEFNGENVATLVESAESLISQLKQQQLGYAFPILQDSHAQAAWEIRRAGLGLLMGITNKRKPITLIEDSAVPPDKLSAFVADFKHFMQEIKVDCVFYGSVSMGLIHLRPLLDLAEPSDRELMKIILHTTSDLLLKYHGTLSAKHGDGTLRAGYIEKMLGSEVYALNRQVKSLFDPNNVFNPNKLFESLPNDHHLRISPNPAEENTQQNLTYFNWSTIQGEQQSLLTASQQCNGAGVCRKLPPQGTMCPSYMATREELHSTRGRANIFRQLLQTKPLHDALVDDALHRALELCLACKGCASECPANVDMARMKAEHLQHYYLVKGMPLRNRFSKHLETVYKLASRFASTSNLIIKTRAVNYFLGITANRHLPLVAISRLSKLIPIDTGIKHGDAHPTQVVILNNIFSEYQEPDIGLAAYKVLQYAKFNARLSPCFKSLRIAISQGMLIEAKSRLRTFLQWINRHCSEDTVFVGLEPSELLALRDDALALADGKQDLLALQKLQSRVFLFEEFILHFEHIFSALFSGVKANTQPILAHVHCHQKSLSDSNACIRAMQLLPGARVTQIPSGCCGMAGMFGYEANHYDLSMQIGEMVLFPTLRQADSNTTIVATGTSCRQQIHDRLKIHALHPAQLFATRLKLV